MWSTNCNRKRDREAVGGRDGLLLLFVMDSPGDVTITDDITVHSRSNGTFQSTAELRMMMFVMKVN